MKQYKKRVLIIAIAVLVIAALLSVYALLKPQTSKGQKTITVSVNAQGYDATHEIQTSSEILSDALLETELVKGEKGPYGFFITEFDGITADGTDGRWWVFTKSNDMVNTGVDSTPIADGDHFEFTVYEG